MVSSLYGNDINILEVGGGFYPVFAQYVSNLQRESKGLGSITVYDPRLITEEVEGLKLHKEKFTSGMDMTPYNLCVGILPCEAIRLIIREATSNEKDFFIAMCGCTHFEKDELSMNFFWNCS